MNKKILAFSLAYYPSFVSGAEAALKEITDRINSDDIEFHLITLLFDEKAPQRERIGNVEVHRIGFGGGYLSKILFVPLAAITARRLHGIHRFDAMWSMMTYMLFPVVLSKMIGVSVPHVLTLQDGDPYEKVFKRWFILPVTPFLDYGFRHASVIQVISTYLGTWPEKRGSKSPVVLIHNGANPRDLHGEPDHSAIEEIKETYGKKDGDVWLVNTARLVHQKAFDDTIKALAMLPNEVKFLVVGDGTDRNMLENLTKELKIKDRVMFVGAVDRSEVTYYRRASDIFVMPSRSEGLGNAGLSALASKLPMVATQEGGLAEYIFDARRNPDKKTTGWAVDPDSPEQIAESVKDILAHPEKAREVSENARKMVLEKYDWDMIGRQMREQVFKKALQE